MKKIGENISLKQLTTFRVGGRAKYLVEVGNKEELIDAVSFAKEKNFPIFVLGGGSDILVSDKDFDGVVIKYTGDKVSFDGEKVTAESGMEWDKLVEEAVRRNLQGIECLSGIPGTCGAAPIQNIGAYGQELKDVFVSLTAYDIQKEKFRVFSKQDCGFFYRGSIFKKPRYWQKFFIVDIKLELTKGGKPAVLYDSLKNYLVENKITNPTLEQVRKTVIAIRATKFENPREVGNAGSFFKNPAVDENKFNDLKKPYPDIKFFESNGKFKLSAGWLIEKSGWKGKTYKSAAVSPRHALVLINPKGKAEANDILELSGKIINDVYDKFGIYLEREVQLINFVKVAILGYGIEGQDAEKYFGNLGTAITILDKKFDEKYLDNLSGFDIVVRSPGVYRYLPEITSAEEKGAKVTSAIKVFFEKCPGKIIGVTGTKGKGTTSTLIYQILKKSGKDVHLAGNIGKPYLGLLPKLKKESIVVLELSSFQLIDLSKSPNIAVVLNITADHLDWHKDLKEYVDSKKNIVRYQNKNDFAVINYEYNTPRSFSKITKAKVVFFSKKSLENKYKENILLKGEHNLENIAAAVSVVKILKIDDKKILEVLGSFKGLEHRLELVKTIGGVTFYNDSFATGPQPTIAAIKSFSEPTTVILGGSEKGLNYTSLGKEIARSKNVEVAIIIGQVGPKIKASLVKAGFSGKILDLDKSPMRKIVKMASEATPKSGVVLLSPAAASFDMFENYKDRGDQFKKAVRELK